MIRLLLVRHGTTAWNRANRYQGQSDLPLDETGLRQARALRRHLSGEKIDAIYASDLQRAWQTASAIAVPHEIAVSREPALREIDFGMWDGYTHEEVKQRHPEDLAIWEADPLTRAPHGGETLAQVSSRVGALLDTIACMHQEHTVMLVAHGGSLQVLLCLTLGLAPKARWQFQLSPASVSELWLEEKSSVLIRLSDRCHLAASLPTQSPFDRSAY